MRLLLTLLIALTATTTAPAGTLIVGNNQEHTLSFIDIESGQEVARSATGLSPHEVVVSPDGKEAVVVSFRMDDFVGDELHVFDVETAKKLKTIKLDGHLAPHGIRWLGDTGTVLVTTENTKDLVKVDIEKGEIVGSVPLAQDGSHYLLVSPDYKTAYVPNRESNTLSVVDVDTMKVLQVIDVAERPEAADLHPNGKELWVANKTSEDVAIFHTDSLEPAGRIDVGGQLIRVRFDPYGDLVTLADMDGNRVFVYDANTREKLAVLDLADYGVKTPATLLFNDDGIMLYVSARDSAHVVEIDMRDSSRFRVFDAGKGADGLAISKVKTVPQSD